MRTGTPEDLINGAAMWGPRVSSWRDGELLAQYVPVMSGRITATVGQQVPERLTLTVPRYDDRGTDDRDWFPGADVDHPLARYGQLLQVSIVMTSTLTGVEYETRMGRFYVQDWKYDSANGVVNVEALGVLQRASDDRLPSPMAPRSDGTLVSEFRRLLPEGLATSVDPALTDRACPRSMEWAEDRIAALYEIADAWPARLRTDQWGQLALLPPLPDMPSPVLTLRDGEGGTVVSSARSDSRDHAYNRVVVRSSNTDSPNREPIQSVVDQATGPMRVGGAYGVVTKYWSSPLITTESQAHASGVTLLANSLRPSRTIPVVLAPDPRIDLDDAVEIISDGARDWGYVTAYDLPLTVSDGEMKIEVGVSS